MVELIDRTLENRERVRLIVLFDALNDPAAAKEFKRLYDALANQPAVKAASQGAERAALRVALERRGVSVR